MFEEVFLASARGFTDQIIAARFSTSYGPVSQRMKILLG
jgi:hypothetical protein